MTPYAGIGSRNTPAPVLAEMTRLAWAYEALGFVLRSGGADGADTAFEAGVTDPAHKEIYLPWRYFNANLSPLNISHPDLALAEAMEMAAAFHPAWDNCKAAAKTLLTRNCFQILGPQLNTPSKFVVCWTPGGRDVGGTAQALRIARAHDIPIRNLGVSP